MSTARHTCRDCNRTQLEPDMYQDGLGSWFCRICWREAEQRMAAWSVAYGALELIDPTEGL